MGLLKKLEMKILSTFRKGSSPASETAGTAGRS